MSGPRSRRSISSPRLDPQQYRQDLEVAKAEVAKADAEVARSQAQEYRQRELLKNGHTTQVEYDQALKTFKTAQAQLDATRAKQVQASENLGYTELKADNDGVITAIGADAGQVVSAGQMVVRLAQPGEREAVFNVAEGRVQKTTEKPDGIGPSGQQSRHHETSGKVRYISPQADPETRTYTVRVSLPDAPPQMRLGANVVGNVTLNQGRVITIPGSALFQKDGKPAVWLVEKDAHGAAEADHRAALSGRLGRRRRRARQRRRRGDRRGAETAPRSESRPHGGECRAMKGFNLSEWAINHRSFVWFLMILFVAAGVLSYRQLGREEDPSFSIKTMIVRTYWPGATIDDTMLQVTDRIEKKLQETPSLYYLKSETKPGVSTIYVNVLDNTPKEAIPDIWYQVRKKVADIKATLPQGVLGPSFNDEFGDVFGIIYAFTADGFTHRELRDYVERIRTQILTIKNAAKAQLIGAQDQKFYLEFDTHQLAGLGVSRDQVISSLQEQNAVTPSGVVQTGLEKFAIRVSGAFSSVDDLKRINLYANGKFFRLADVASISKGYADPPQPMFRFNGEPAIGLAISMAQGGNNLVFGEAVAHKMDQIVAKLPIGIEAHLVADQPVVVEEAVGGFTKALWEAIAIVLARQLPEPRPARRSGRRLLDPARARHGLCLHGVFRHQPAAHLARRADHCARPPCR